MHRHANWLLKSWQQLLSSGDAEGACCSLAVFLCFRWMILQLQEGEESADCYPSTSRPSPQGAAVCFWSLWKWVQAAPRMR